MALYPKPYGSLKMLQKQELLAHVERAVEAYIGSLPFRVARYYPYCVQGQTLAFCSGLEGR